MNRSATANGRRRVACFVACVVLACVVYAAGVPGNPPGFYIDESSIAYNAYTISRTARDEHGELLPLYFRAFGEYKNPVYIYLLAALFKLTGASIFAARMLSAALGLFACAALALLALRLTRSVVVASLVAAQALLTPWLFENSRLAFEVALYPLALALFLLALARAATKPRWSMPDAATLAATLALLTYAYSIGRLLAPLFALGLALFLTRTRWRGVLLAWLLYLFTLAPLLVFQLRHPGALTGRFSALSYVNSESSPAMVAAEFARHYWADVSLRRLLLTGETNLRDHVPGMGGVLLATMLLAALGLCLVLRSYRRDAWWRFILYGLAVSPIPAALTVNEFPTLRLVALPVFLLALTIPALSWLAGSEEPETNRAEVVTPETSRTETGGTERDRTETSVRAATTKARRGFSSRGRRAALALLLGLTLLQGLVFQWQFHRGSPERGYLFDSHYPRVLDAAVRAGRRPIYLRERAGGSGYIQAYWYATLRGMSASEFVRLPTEQRPPAGALVLSTEESCDDCRIILRSINYIIYLAAAPGSNSNAAAPLPPGAFRARITLTDAPAPLRARQPFTVHVQLTNDGNATWPAFGQSDGRYAVVLRNLWRDASTGALVNDRDGATTLLSDLSPGGDAQLSLTLHAPETPGEYLLELDLVQNQTSWFTRRLNDYIDERNPLQPQATWFQQHGSQPLRQKVRVGL